MKSFFQIKDNILDKKLKKVINGQSFIYNRSIIVEKVNEIIHFYATHFTKDNEIWAYEQLRSTAENLELRRKDATHIAFFGGTGAVLTFLVASIVTLPEVGLEKQGAASTENELLSSLHTFRFLFMMIFLLISAGVVVRQLRRYQINY